MDVATRFHTRARAGSNFDENGKFVANDTATSSGESEVNFVRRKFQRTTTDPDLAAATETTAFRKPAIPASATRAANTAGLDHRPSLTQQQRRRSTLQRENFRVPSGPRGLSTAAERPRKASAASTTPSIADSTNSARSYLPQPNTDAFFDDPQMASSLAQLNFAPTNGRLSSLEFPSLSAGHPVESRAPFLPEVNFDDFQSGIRDTNVTNYGANGSLLLNDADAWRNERQRQDIMVGMGNTNGFGARRGDLRAQTSPSKSDMGRMPSLRERLASGRQPVTAQQGRPSVEVVSSLSKDDSWRSRRQSSISQPAGAQIAPGSSTFRAPRKSVGPGVLSTADAKNIRAAPAGMVLLPESVLKPSLARNGSITKSSRRTTMQPAASAGAELPRVSTLTATTQSRQNKVKSLQQPPRDIHDVGSSPTSVKASSKTTPNRNNTPSSSGNRRQSMAQARPLSGLGARTISPTDVRRQNKRASAMNPPPMPQNSLLSKAPPTPQEETLNAISLDNIRQTELPRFTQPSPSMIPIRTSMQTPSSARASPEGKSGGVSLTSKSSFSSLYNASLSGSSSRLPTPKPRSVGQTGSSMGQYRDSYESQELYTSLPSGREMVPPVPAIPKAYESPRDLECEPPFFSSLNPLESLMSGTPFDTPPRVSLNFSSGASLDPRPSFDMPYEIPRKQSVEQARSKLIAVQPLEPPKTTRYQSDSNGRQNANLQPLRLPPLNLMPLNTKAIDNAGRSGRPRPSQEIDNQDDFANVQTPEPKRTAKTPSTPMTASKATFYRRKEEMNKALRSSSSHYALRDVMGMDADGNMLTKYWDDSDNENTQSVGVTIQSMPRNAITPFSSGSLPKGSGEFARLRGRPSGEYIEDTARVRPQRGGTMNSLKSSIGGETPMRVESPTVEMPPQFDFKKDNDKKEQTVRRKLSLGWRRSSSKSVSHADNKASSPQDAQVSSEREREYRNKLQKAPPSDMAPPKLPASAKSSWSGDFPALSSGTRPSLEGVGKRKSQAPASASTTSLVNSSDADSVATGGKTRSQHCEQPTPVATPSAIRSSSWSTLGSAFRSTNIKPPAAPKHRLTPSAVSALMKDKDDLTADDEMARLSRKRKDVDSAARDSDELNKRAVARTAITAEHVLHDRTLTGGSVLNVFERGEIVDHEKDGIYFTGTKSAKKIIGSLSPSPQISAASSTVEKAAGGSMNFGYDDERGDYNIIIGDHLAYRYEVVDVLGKGSFGQVVRCIDHKDGAVVAVKIIRNKKRFHQQALVEVGILGKLREWDVNGAHATLSITSSFYFRSHLCIVTPCLSINLYELIRAHNFTGFSLPLIRRFARQLLSCLTLLQSKRIIHCDLKPENILLCEARKADVRVIDFGSSCREEEKVYTYIQSRFYRSPEVILGSSYGLGIDMWSLGCILAELWTGYPIFPGENEQEQLACIMEIFGPPDRHLVERCTRKKLFFDSVGKPRVTVSSKGRRRRPSSKTLQQALKSEDEAFIDFISRCLRWDPDRRLKPSEAVGHPFILNLPFNQKSSIPDEARRAARARSTAAVPTTNGGTVPSPVKRGTTTSSGNAFVSSQAVTATPGKERSKPIPETPQTSLRSGAPTAIPATLHGSPVKSSAPPNPNRRHSTVTTAGAAAMAGTKRASNGTLVGASSSATNLPPPPPPLHSTRSAAAGNLAQIAARESMGAAQQSSASTRWRT